MSNAVEELRLKSLSRINERVCRARYNLERHKFDYPHEASITLNLTDYERLLKDSFDLVTRMMHDARKVIVDAKKS